MRGWIAKALAIGAGAAVAAAAGAAGVPSPAAAAPATFAVPGGQVRVLDMPRADRPIRNAVVRTVTEELANQLAEPLRPLDANRCRTAEVIVTLEREATLQRRWTADGNEPKQIAALFVPGSPCRIWLNARELHRFDEARVCNVMRHELGHARGLDHDAGGFMALKLPFLPVSGCKWARSRWLDE